MLNVRLPAQDALPSLVENLEEFVHSIGAEHAYACLSEVGYTLKEWRLCQVSSYVYDASQFGSLAWAVGSGERAGHTLAYLSA